MRGLHLLGDEDIVGERIIPARAGFTGIISAQMIPGGDHPRACGVYLSFSSRISLSAGSSPRVRGLLSLEEIDIEGKRIIPARAGFTSGRS